MDEGARAYAVLGVSPDVSFADLRRRYKALVKQWHPDRFADDPAGQAEASARMRQINDAYRTLLGRVAAFQAAPGGPPSGAGRAPGQRLPREDIERIVRAIGTDGPLDHLLDRFDEHVANERVAVVFAGFGLCWLLIRFGWSPWHALWITTLAAGAVAAWRRARSRRGGPPV